MPFTLRAIYCIPNELIREAEVYAGLSGRYTSDAHDFHTGGLNNKQHKMFEGKLGEKVFKMFLQDNHISFEEDRTSYTESDNYDFILPNTVTIDVKTRTKSFHTRTLEIAKTFINNPKDIYISIYLDFEKKEGTIIGFATKETFAELNQIQNNGYGDNYVLYDNQLSNIEEFFNYCIENNLIE